MLFVDEGKDALTLSDFVSEMREHDVDLGQIKTISMDFSGAFRAGATRDLLGAQVCFDQFHLISLACTTDDEVRRSEFKTAPELKGQRYSLFKDQAKLKASQRAFVESLATSHLKTAEAWRHKVLLRDLARNSDNLTEAALKDQLKLLCKSLQASELTP